MKSDARHYAALIIEQLQLTPLKKSFCCYGTKDGVVIGIGRDSSLHLNKTGTLDAVWAGINEYIENNRNDYIFGFIGFDPSNQLNKKIKNYQQKIDLFVPNTVIECKTSGCTVLKGEANINAIDESSATGYSNPVNISELDQAELRNQYAESVSCFINAIQNGSIERATYARKINSQNEFDLMGTFISDHSQHELARNFYFSNESIAFAGQCPELLAEGDTQSFATHKLSGTCAKNGSLSIAELVSSFQADTRISCEHHSAISTIEDSLADIGEVQVTKFKVMELPTLLHGWSEFVTQPDNGTTVANCLRSVFPFGVNPVEPGLKLLAQHEDFCRGPYYGITGCVQPNGEFSFTQVLRSAFVDNNSSYLMAGAAITQHSTAELEVNETCTKLFGIQVFERTQ